MLYIQYACWYYYIVSVLVQECQEWMYTLLFIVLFLCYGDIWSNL